MERRAVQRLELPGAVRGAVDGDSMVLEIADYAATVTAAHAGRFADRRVPEHR